MKENWVQIKYIHLKDSILNDSLQESGQMVILPYSIQVPNFELHNYFKYKYVHTYHYIGFLGGPRTMCENARDGLS